MITAGIDVGAKTIKAVIVRDEKIIGKAVTTAGTNTKNSAEKVFKMALKDASIPRKDVEIILSTGVGRKEIPFATDSITEISADAKGSISLIASARTVIDVGAEGGRAIRIDEKGKIIDFAINEKCAAGAGSFAETMARLLEVKIDEFGELSLKSNKPVSMNAQCAVFAESEVITLIHSKIPKADIARAINKTIADKIASIVKHIGVQKDVILIGGVAKNIGFVKALEDNLETKIFVPQEPEFVGAYGAALAASERPCTDKKRAI